MSTPKNIGSFRKATLSDADFVLFSNPAFWRAKSKELHRAALVVAKQVGEDWAALMRNAEAKDAGHITDIPDPPTNIMPQFVLLAAFSLENMLKGLILFKEPGLVTGGKTTDVLRSHDLIALADRAGVQLTDDEANLCKLASSASTYWGRYPISNSVGTYIDSYGIGGESIAEFENLFSRLEDIYLVQARGRSAG